MRRTTRTFLTAAALAASWPVAAQTAGGGSAEQAAYRSAFEGYRPFEAGEVQDWRKSNDTVREIGGWRAYAREIQGARQKEGASPKPGAASPPGATPPQGGAAPAGAHEGHHR